MEIIDKIIRKTFRYLWVPVILAAVFLLYLSSSPPLDFSREPTQTTDPCKKYPQLEKNNKGVLEEGSTTDFIQQYSGAIYTVVVEDGEAKIYLNEDIKHHIEGCGNPFFDVGIYIFVDADGIFHYRFDIAFWNMFQK